MGRRRTGAINRSRKEPKKEIVFHQQNPPPGNLAACGKIDSDVLTTDRDQVDCPDCLSRPDPTIVIR